MLQARFDGLYRKVQNRKNMNPYRKSKNGKIENVTASVWLNLFIAISAHAQRYN
jgi:hypothetical protein